MPTNPADQRQRENREVITHRLQRQRENLAKVVALERDPPHYEPYAWYRQLPTGDKRGPILSKDASQTRVA